MMSDADVAYAAAVAEIARVMMDQGSMLDLSGEQFFHLDRLPPRVVRIPRLRSLNLSGTKIGDADLAVLPDRKRCSGLTFLLTV